MYMSERYRGRKIIIVPMKTQRCIIYVIRALIVGLSFIACQLKGRDGRNVSETQDALPANNTDNVNGVDKADTVYACQDMTRCDMETESKEHLHKIINSIVKRHRTELASLCRYPIKREYPLHNIENAGEMKRYFDIMFDKSFRTWLKDIGEEGWTYDGFIHPGFTCNGKMWVCGLLYDVCYSSAKEQKNRQKLMTREIKILHKSLRGKGWQPFFCYREVMDTSVIRIDRRDSEFRFAKYKRGCKSFSLPDIIMYGKVYTGSDGAIDLVFRNDNGDTVYIHDAVNFGDGFYDDTVTIDYYGKNKNEDGLILIKFYWLDNMVK